MAEPQRPWALWKSACMTAIAHFDDARLAKTLEDHDEVAQGMSNGDLRTDQAR